MTETRNIDSDPKPLNFGPSDTGPLTCICKGTRFHVYLDRLECAECQYVVTREELEA